MDHVVPIVLFLVIGLVLCTFFFFRYRARQEIQHTVRLAVERGNELSPELLEAISLEVAGGSRDLRRGVISLALAVALGISAWLIDETGLLGVASFPLMLGIAYLGLWRFHPSRSA
jgi:hypothetical protein